MASLAVHALSGVFRLTRKRPVETVAGARVRINESKDDPAPPAWVARRHTITRHEVGGFAAYTVLPRRGSVLPGRAVLYAHGGSYVSEITPWHWAFVSRVADAGCRVEVPVYGLAPRHTHEEALPLFAEVHRRLLEDVEPERIAFAGDSAGAGLVLAFAQSLPAAGLPVPARLVLVSPWVDLTMSNPAIAEADAADPWLSPVALLESARAWSGGDDLSAPGLSPLNGPMEGLPPTDLYIGTRDVFHPDALRLRAALEDAGVTVRHHEAVGAFHVYPLVPCAEGYRARRWILATLRGL